MPGASHPWTPARPSTRRPKARRRRVPSQIGMGDDLACTGHPHERCSRLILGANGKETSLRRLGWQSGHETLAPLKPEAQLGLGLYALGIDEHVALHGSAGEVHFADVLATQRVRVILLADASHERGVRDSHEHEPLAQKGNTSEHLLLGDGSIASQCRADALSEPFVVRHAFALRSLDGMIPGEVMADPRSSSRVRLTRPESPRAPGPARASRSAMAESTRTLYVELDLHEASIIIPYAPEERGARS